MWDGGAGESCSEHARQTVTRQIDDLLMGNLGRYQEIVELAKQSGGVDPMLDTIKKGAVADAAPKLIGVGVAAGAAVAVGIPKGYDWMKQTIASRRQAMKNGMRPNKTSAKP